LNTSHVNIDPAIFSAYDIRGIYGKDLTDEIAYRIGRAAALHLQVPEIAVGRDMRVSSPALAAAILRGITDQGVNAIELGMTTTDELYFAVGKLDWQKFEISPYAASFQSQPAKARSSSAM
jgi:phosphomannomutase